MSIPSRDKSGGFLLLEALICLLLISIFSVLISSWYVKMVEAQNLTVRVSEAVLLASNLIETVKMSNNIPKINSNGIFQIKWKIKSNPKVSSFKNITVYVSWKEKESRKEIFLSTGITGLTEESIAA